MQNHNCRYHVFWQTFRFAFFLRYGIMMEWYQELGGCVLYPGPAFSILEDELTDAEKAEIARNAYQADQ